jgi:two-component system, OmpR family, sensor histidine kinase MtrB
VPVRVFAAGRMRRRLTVAFMLVAGLSAAALAAGSFVLVRESRMRDSVDRSLDQGRSNLLLAADVLGASPDPADVSRLLAAYERRGTFTTVTVTGGRAASSSVSVGPAQVPPELRRLVRGERLAYQRTTVADTRYLVVGGAPPGTRSELYFFFSEERLFDELAQLRTVLLFGSALLILLAGVAGALVARRTLAPVAKASDAARSLAEGLLATRLPVETKDEFGMWAASFNEMAQALETKINDLSEAQARERRFTADVAHELRTPLTALVAEASLLADHLADMPPGARRPAELLVADVTRLRDLVEDLMEISRLDAGMEPVRPERVDLTSLVKAFVRAQRWEERVAVSGDGAAVHVDPGRLERIVSNLVANALEHGDGAVSVRVGRDSAQAFVEVSDRGGGIAPEHLPHLFERFYKADPARGGRGSGLGLAIARENARLLGGELDVWSEPGRGSRFTLRLPVTQPLRAGEEGVSSALDDGGGSHEGGER